MKNINVTQNTLLKALKPYEHMIEEIEREYDNAGEGDWSYWIYLVEGYCNSYDDINGTHIIHEWRIKDIIPQLKYIVKCDCEECSRV